VRPPNRTRTYTVPHLSQGGEAYAPEVWDQVISIWQKSGDLSSHELQEIRQQKKISIIGHVR
jgi:hypothetical protein